MAKRGNAMSYTGKFYVNPKNNHIIAVEYDKKADQTSYYDVTEDIKRFFMDVDGDVTLSLSEKAIVHSHLDDPFTDDQE